MNEKHLVEPSKSELITICIPNGRFVLAYPVVGTPGALGGVVHYTATLLWEDGKHPAIPEFKVRNSKMELCSMVSISETGELHPRRLSGVIVSCVLDYFDLILGELDNIVYITVE